MNEANEWLLKRERERERGQARPGRIAPSGFRVSITWFRVFVFHLRGFRISNTRGLGFFFHLPGFRAMYV